jgi:hypothetical protein
MPQCYQLTQDQLTQYLALGYTKLGGPFNSQAECNANCGSQSGSAGAGSGAAGASSGASFASSGSAAGAWYCVEGAHSSAGGVSVGCCGSTLSTTLNAQVTTGSGCSCAGTSNIPIVWNGTAWTGSGALGTCGHTLTITLSCSGSTWTLQYIGSGGCSSGSITPTGTCPPLTGVFAGSDACCTGGLGFPLTYTIVVS